MRCSAENWLELFDINCESAYQGMPPRVRRGESGVLRYRVKTIRAGSQVEVEAYPVWDTSPKERQIKKSKEAIARANAENARKHFERKMNTNFTDADYRVDLTYADDFLPDTKQAKLDVQNYLRRIKYACRKQEMPTPKYMGVSEGKREGSRQKRVHHHIVISCGLTRDELEAIWGRGRARTDRLQGDQYGYTALARYLMKEPEGAKRYFCSRNLKEPRITISETKLSMRKAERVAASVEEYAPEIFRRIYKDHEFLDCQVKRSDFVVGVYIYARLRKQDGQVVGECGGVKNSKSTGRLLRAREGGTRLKSESSGGNSVNIVCMT